MAEMKLDKEFDYIGQLFVDVYTALFYGGDKVIEENLAKIEKLK